MVNNPEFKEAVQVIVEDLTELVESREYIHRLIKAAEQISGLLWNTKYNDRGLPLWPDVLELAAKAKDNNSYISVLLQHCVLNCEDDGFTFDYLKHNLPFPLVIIQQVKAQLKSSEETYSQYIDRLTQNPLATDAILRELAHYSDITRYDHPTRMDIIRCTMQLERAMMIKNNPNVQKLINFGPLETLKAMSRVAPMDIREVKWEGGDRIWHFFYSGSVSPLGAISLASVVNEKKNCVEVFLNIGFTNKVSHFNCNNKNVSKYFTLKDTNELSQYIEHVSKVLSKEICSTRFYN